MSDATPPAAESPPLRVRLMQCAGDGFTLAVAVTLLYLAGVPMPWDAGPTPSPAAASSTNGTVVAPVVVAPVVVAPVVVAPVVVAPVVSGRPAARAGERRGRSCDGNAGRH